MPNFIPRLESLENRDLLATLVVSPGGMVPGSFASIGAAVNAASPGDTVLVDPGTYTEQVMITKNLTLQGNGAGAIISSPSTLTPSLGFSSLLQVSNAATVNINNMTIEGPNPTINAGIYVAGGATANVTGTTILNINRGAANFGVQTGYGILVGSTGQMQVGHATITGCTIEGYQKSAIITGGTGTTVTANDNTITGIGPTTLIAQNGIQITEGTTATVDNNTVTGNEFTGNNSGPDPTMNVQSVGILVLTTTTVAGNTTTGNDIGIDNLGGTGTSITGNDVQANRFEGILLNQGTATVSANTVSGNNIGVALIADSGDTTNAQGTLISNNITNNGNGSIGFQGGGIRLLVGPGATTTDLLTANFNRIVGNALGLGNGTTATVDATNNWWGSNAGPGSAVTGPVTFNPWLVLQVTASPNSVQTGGTATVVANLTTNSNGADTSAQGSVPDGIPVSFATNLGSISPSSGILNSGTATSQVTFGGTPGTVTVSATVDSQTSTAQITVTSPPTLPPPPTCMIPPFATTPNQIYVAQVYCDLLGRTADQGGLNFWTSFINQGTAPALVVFGMQWALPNEYQTIVVDNLYQQYLHRAPDPGGLASSLAFLNSGGTNEQLAAIIAGSPEFFALAGGTNAGFLNALYADALGRGVDGSGAASWGGFLANGVSRNAVALGILSSVEYHTNLVESYYEMFLRRSADPGGLAVYVNLLQHGSTDQQIISFILGSPEYFSRAVAGEFMMP
jgi:hypothetical protein